jgi:CHAT domain-containing protein
MFGLVAGLGATSLVLQPVAGQIHIFLLRPPAGLVIAQSTIPSQAVAEALDRLQAELGVFALARARSGGTPPLADVETDREALAGAIQSVSDALFTPLGPALELLRRGESLIVVPYRELSLIPYSLLLLPDGTPLVERVAVSLVPSLATLSLVRREVQGEESGGCLIVGNPAVDPLSGLQPLPAAAWEAREVRDLLLAAGVREDRIALRLDEQASEPEYRASARHCRLVHLACHAAVREPVARSALYLSPGPHDDGQLLPAEIAEIRLSGALVFLSACQTGLGRPTADGVIGLSRAFLEAGARCVVMSMWKVADEAAAHLASQFYTNWLGLNGPAKTAAHALQAAMLATRADLAAGKVITSRHEVLDDHPAHWAPFLLLGDGGMTFRD